MAALRFSRTDDSQVDPFNAGEPELPGGEPDLPSGDDGPWGREEPWAQGKPEGDDGWHGDGGSGAQRPRTRYAAHGEAGGEPHKPSDDYQAPTTTGQSYDAPSTDDPEPAPRAGRRGRRGEKTDRDERATRGEKNGRTEKGARSANSPTGDKNERSRRSRAPREQGTGTQRTRRRQAAPPGPDAMPGDAPDDVTERTRRDQGIAGRVIVGIVLLATFGSWIVSCTASLAGDVVDGVGGVVDDVVEAVFEDDAEGTGSAFDTAYEMDDDDRAAVAALGARLDDLLAQRDEGRLHEMVSDYFEGRVLEVDGYATDQLGIDADRIARFVVEGTRAEADHAYAYGDGTASAYANITSYSAADLFTALEDAYSPYLFENGLWGWGDGAPTSRDRERVAEIVEDVLAGYDERRSSSYRFELELSDDEWAVDEEDLEETMEDALELY